MTGITCKTTYPITGLGGKNNKTSHTNRNLCGNINKISVNRVCQTRNPMVHQNITLQQISSHKIACRLISPLGMFLMYLIPYWSYEALRLRKCSTAQTSTQNVLASCESLNNTLPTVYKHCKGQKKQLLHNESLTSQHQHIKFCLLQTTSKF